VTRKTSEIANTRKNANVSLRTAQITVAYLKLEVKLKTYNCPVVSEGGCQQTDFILKFLEIALIRSNTKAVTKTTNNLLRKKHHNQHPTF
jgi:hypothetical protein